MYYIIINNNNNKERERFLKTCQKIKEKKKIF
jgi:hypothetical protein